LKGTVRSAPYLISILSPIYSFSGMICGYLFEIFFVGTNLSVFSDWTARGQRTVQNVQTSKRRQSAPLGNLEPRSPAAKRKQSEIWVWDQLTS